MEKNDTVRNAWLKTATPEPGIFVNLSLMQFFKQTDGTGTAGLSMKVEQNK